MPTSSRAFLDPNVLFSAAFLSRGNAPRLLTLGTVGACALLTSERALDEARRSLSRKSSPPTLARLPEPDDALIAWATARGLPAKDAPTLAAAVHAGAYLLMTGDRRYFDPIFGSTLRRVHIVSLADGLAAVVAAAERA